MTSTPDGAWQRLAEAYEGRTAAAHDAARRGAFVVGIIGADVSAALVSAAGAEPLRLAAGHSGATSPDAAALLGAAVDPPFQSLLSQLRSGELDFLSGLLISRDCQGSLQLFYVLRELVREGLVPFPVHLVQMLHLDREPTLRFNEQQAHSAAAVLEEWTGTAISAQALAASIAGHARVAAVLGELQRERRQPRPRVSGTQFLQAVAVAAALPPARALELLLPVVGAVHGADAPPLPAVRLYLTGSSQSRLDVYRGIEESGAVVVGEDHDWGDLYLRALPIDAHAQGDRGAMLNALAAVARANGPASPSSGIRDRAVWTAAEAAACGADALLSVVREFDEAPAWDFPLQRAAAAEHGIPALLLPRQPAEADVHALRAAATELADRVGAADLFIDTQSQRELA